MATGKPPAKRQQFHLNTNSDSSDRASCTLHGSDLTMASVTSLDKDLRNMRLSRYTPQAAAEVRDWIEEVLHEKLPSSDLLDGLKDGSALCK